MKRYAGVFFVVGLTLLLIGTVTYYATRVSGNVTGTTLRFEFNMTKIINSNESNFNVVDLYDTADAHNGTSGIVPGDKGHFVVKLDSVGSGVDIEYTITFSSSELPSNMKFYTDSNKTFVADFLNTYTISGTLKKNSDKSYVIYWEWPYDSGNNNKDDINYAGREFSVNVSAQGKQVDG